MSRKPGGYSISLNLEFPWKKGEKGKAVETKKTKKILKPTINPIFEKCANLTDDDYWKDIFNDCAKGTFPRNFTFKNGILTHKKGNKINRLEISESPIEAFQSSLRFFQEEGGNLSDRDRKRLQMLEEEKLLELANFSNKTWKDIKTEKLRDILIAEFINNVCEKHDFDEEEKTELSTTIKKGLMLKYLDKNNIILKEGKITEIGGLKYNKETNSYEIDKKRMVKRAYRPKENLGIEREERVSGINFMIKWEKYLEALETKKLRKKTNYSSSVAVTDMSEDATGSLSRTMDVSYAS